MGQHARCFFLSSASPDVPRLCKELKMPRAGSARRTAREFMDACVSSDTEGAPDSEDDDVHDMELLTNEWAGHFNLVLNAGKWGLDGTSKDASAAAIDQFLEGSNSCATNSGRACKKRRVGRSATERRLRLLDARYAGIEKTARVNLKQRLSVKDPFVLRTQQLLLKFAVHCAEHETKVELESPGLAGITARSRSSSGGSASDGDWEFVNVDTPQSMDSSVPSPSQGFASDRSDTPFDRNDSLVDVTAGHDVDFSKMDHTKTLVRLETQSQTHTGDSTGAGTIDPWDESRAFKPSGEEGECRLVHEYYPDWAGTGLPALVLFVPDSFHRLLCHGLAQFCHLKSVSENFSTLIGARAHQGKRGKKRSMVGGTRLLRHANKKAAAQAHNQPSDSLLFDRPVIITPDPLQSDPAKRSSILEAPVSLSSYFELVMGAQAERRRSGRDATAKRARSRRSKSAVRFPAPLPVGVLPPALEQLVRFEREGGNAASASSSAAVRAAHLVQLQMAQYEQRLELPPAASAALAAAVEAATRGRGGSPSPKQASRHQ